METEKDISFKIEALHNKARVLLKKQYTEEQIVTELCKAGISADYARTILENVYSDNQLIKEFRGTLITGLFITIGGLAVNLLSLKYAQESGSTSFLLLWGIVVAGILMIIRAISLYRRTR